MKSPALLILDLDGTLVDTANGIVDAALFAFRQADLRVEQEWMRQRLGAPLDELWGLMGGADHSYETFETDYQRYYDDHGYDGVVVFPRVDDTLRALHGRARTAVATTKPTRAAERTLESAGLQGAIDVVQGTDGFPHKPNPTIIRRVLARMEVSPHEALMIGDTDRDVLAGKAAGVRTVGVTYGAGQTAALRAAAPDALIDCFSELTRWFEASPGS